MSDQSKLQSVRIRIKNYQSIEDIELEVRGFTCITGPTNIGKSAIMRSISSAILNKPVGSSVREGATFCSVEMRSETGWGFLWEKGERGVNRCTIDGKTYDKIGRSQLPEIASMGFKSISLGDKEAHPWWAKQFFPLFLIDESGQSVTDFISKVSRLTVLQDAISMSARGKLRANDDAKRKVEAAQKLRDRLGKISGIDPVIRLRQELRDQAESVREYENRITEGQKYFDIITISSKKIEAFKDVESLKEPEDVISEDVPRLVSMNSHYKKCESLAKRIISVRDVVKVAVPEIPSGEYSRYKSIIRFENIAKLQTSLEATQDISKVKVPAQVDAEKAASNLSKAVEYDKRLKALAKSVRSVSKSVADPGPVPDIGNLRLLEEKNDQIVCLKNDILRLSESISEFSTELASLESRIAAIPTCDACGRPTSGLESHSHREESVHLS